MAGILGGVGKDRRVTSQMSSQSALTHRASAAETSAISSATAGRFMSTCGFSHIPAILPMDD